MLSMDQRALVENEALLAILENYETKTWFLGVVSKFSNSPNSVRENSNTGEAQNQRHFANEKVRLPEFESGLEAWKASVLDQARPQPLNRPEG